MYNNNSDSIRYYLSPFQNLIADPMVTEICVNQKNTIWYEKNSNWASVDDEKLSYDFLTSLSIATAAYAKTDISENNPILSTELPDKERIQIVMPPACESGGVSITIRKPSPLTRTLTDYEDQGFFDLIKPLGTGLLAEEQELLALKNNHNYVEFLRRAVALNKVIVVAGETGSGKTTFMKALMQEIPQYQRIITIEDTHELFLPNHPNHVHLLYKSEAKEGDSVTATTLLKSTLRMKPDRILLAELRGAETFDFINICASGHGGSITSCHAGSSQLVFERLALMLMQNPQGRNLPYEVIRKLLHMVVDVIVIVHNSPEHGRHIPELWYDPTIKRAIQ